MTASIATEAASTATTESTAEAAQREGFTTAEARPPLRTRAWRARWWIVGVSGFVAIMALAVHTASPESAEALSTLNPNPTGAMATAEILRDQGVRLHEFDYLERARIGDPSNTTLVITLPSTLLHDQLESILEYPGDIVFLGSSLAITYALDDWLPAADLHYETSTEQGVRDAACDNLDAQAAGRIDVGGPGIASDDWSGAVACFPDSTGAAAYVVVERDSRTITIVTDPVLAMNESLTTEGNAALVFRTLGHHANVAWYLRALDDTSVLVFPGSRSGPGTGPVPDSVSISPDFLPTGTVDALWALALAGLVAALWKGRRMGRLVPEPLPVIVHASESTRGRGRLYRKAHASGRASAALRAAAAERMGRRLGVPRSADAPALIGAIARASGRDAPGIERLLYGPPPPSEAAMMDLVKELDALEKEVHRP